MKPFAACLAPVLGLEHELSIYIPKALHPKLVCWSCPPYVKIKLNVDGSFISSIGLARGGGLIHSSSGSLLAGFAYSFNHKTILEAELLALIKGLQLCLDNNFLRL
ncbi:hypothetical protein ACH5RR_006975 [Cinchona calisaya]|uniref:RNase H type-1 domain-containing protein n=1 Tax=Cinchona calisaya TaxID=153742 RepID=A0ABD3AQL1_9GENT